MSSSQPAPTHKETHSSSAASSSSEDLEVQEINIRHRIDHGILLQDTNYTKDTVAKSEYLSKSRTGKEGQRDGEETKHVGFWHHDLNNVRLHVLKLWARTGEVNQNAYPSLAVDDLLFSPDPHGLCLTCALSLQRRLLPHTEELLIIGCLRRRL